jgi:hypothetical protein
MDSFEAERRDAGPGRNYAPQDRARQGVISGRVLTVLVCSLVLAIVAMFIGWFAFR